MLKIEEDDELHRMMLMLMNENLELKKKRKFHLRRFDFKSNLLVELLFKDEGIE
jgi:hypothetical protein